MDSIGRAIGGASGVVPIRVDAPGVEPVSLAEMRGYLRLDPDAGDEDALVASLIQAARAAVERATGRLLAPGRYRLALTAWPAGGVLPLPLSPLVGLAHAGVVDAEGSVTDLAPGLVRVGPDPWEAPCLLVGAGAPALARAAALIEVVAGCGGDGPPVPAPLAQAVRMAVAQWFENRGDAADPASAGALPAAVAGLIAPYRRLRL